ncbi:MAG: fumarylacetoacetase [Rhodospirillales bacterium]|nr:fumarylacetoacetase [Rhodospirillales bacterium]
MIDCTHDAAPARWVASARGHADFPLQNLPHGVFSPPGGGPRGGVAIGESILDLPACLEAGLLDGAAAEAAAAATLNGFLALGPAARAGLRGRLFDLLAESAPARVQARARPLLREAAACALHVPARIGDYTDFYAGIQHALNVGRLLRPDQPLMENYKYLPVAYHGRASSIRPSGGAVRRPNGQRKPATETVPSFGPSRNLDYELELGIWVGPGNELGEPVPIGEAAGHIAGFCLLNDWSARDIQGWEYQPLGPFLAKSFHTTISPWIVTPEAMAPFRVAQSPRAEGDPAILAHLHDAQDQAGGALDLELEVLLTTAAMRAAGMPAHRLSLGNARHLYWTVAQMLAHHTSAGCNLAPGDLFGSGTISAPGPDGWGSLLEITRGGRQPISLGTGPLGTVESRRFLEDGDEICFYARARRPGFAGIGFGACRGTILPARAAA